MRAPLGLSQLGLSLAAGSLTTLSPCVFPLLPLVLLGAAGVAILSGADKWLEAQVLDRLPDAWLRLTTLL